MGFFRFLIDEYRQRIRGRKPKNMDDEIQRLADLKFYKFLENMDKEIGQKERKLMAGGRFQSGATIEAFLNLNFEKVETLCLKRIEIEKELMLDKYGYLPDSRMEQLRKTARGIIAREMRILSEQRIMEFQGFGGAVLRLALENIREKEIVLGFKLDRDIEIEKGEDKLRLEKEKRERYSIDNVDSLMKIFGLRDKVNLLFEGKYGFRILKLEHEEVFPKIVEPCKSDTDFATKIAVLGNLLDWMDVNGMKTIIKTVDEGDKSITLLEKLLNQDFPAYAGVVVKNLRVINKLRNKTFPIHKEGAEVIDIFRHLGENYPPKDWDVTWKKVLNLYMDSLKNLIQMFQK
jgi:hypothetical protein